MKMKNLELILKLKLILVALFCAGTVFSQVNGYNYSSSTGGTLEPGPFTNLVGTSCDDCVSALTPIGFTFNYGGTNYTNFTATSNGTLMFGAAANVWYVNDIDNTSGFWGTTLSGPYLLPYWDDNFTDIDGNVQYKLVGVPGSQKLIIEYNLSWLGAQGTADKHFQVWLFEGTNQIQFVYGAGNNLNDFPSACDYCGTTIGILTDGVSDFISITTPANTASTVTPNENNEFWPGAGTIYSFSPSCGPLAQTVSPATQAVCPNTSATIQIASSEIGVEYVLRDDSDDSVIDGPIMGTGGVLNFNTGSLSANTNYNVFATGPSGGLDFDGIDDEVVVPNAASLNISGQLTLEAWVKPELGNTVQNVICKSSSAQNTGYIIRTDNNWTSFVTYMFIGGGWQTISAPFPAVGQWHHIASTYDGTTIRLYLDGVEVNSQAVAGVITTNTNPLALGQQTGFINEWYSGTMDEVRVWNITRTPAEVLADVTNCLAGTEPGLVAYYQFEDGTGSATLSDLTANANNGTLSLMDPATDWVSGVLNCSTCTTEMTPVVAVTIDAAPTAVCQDITVQLDGSGNVTILPSQVDNGSSDNCSTIDLALDITDFDCTVLGPNTVTLTVTREPSAVLVPVPPAGCIGHWTYEPGQELIDLTGNWSPLTVNGSAAIAGGNLDVDNAPNGYARAAGYAGAPISSKTLVAFLTLDDYTVLAGSPLTIDAISIDNFDGLIYGEASPFRWQNGSTTGLRNSPFAPGFAESANDVPVQIAISYDVVGPNVTITGYRNGVQIGNYTIGNAATWTAGDVEMLMGIRHLNPGPIGSMDAKIDETLLFNRVLTPAEIAAMMPATATCTAVVTVEDNISPTITCATPAVNYGTNTGCTYVHSGTALDPTATADNCSVASIINNFNTSATLDGAVFPLGSTTVVWTVTDGSGNSATCQYDVVVVDAIAPGAGFGVGTMGDPFTTTSSAYISGYPDGNYYFDIAGNLFEATVDNTTDGGGWILILNYVHQGGTNPVPDPRTTNLPIQTGAGLGVNEFGTGAWGHAGNALLNSLDPEELKFFAVTSAHGRVINFKTDMASGIAYATSGIGSFTGLENPVNYTLLPGHTATLVPSASLNGFFTNEGDLALTNFPFWVSSTAHWGIQGMGNRWEVDDFPNNFANSTIHRAWARDNDPATPVALPDFTAECSASPVAPTLNDNCVGSVTGTPSPALPITTQGTTVVTWSFDDGNGNVSTRNQNVIIDDVTPPVITCPANIAVNNDAGVCGAVVTFSDATVTDNCSGASVAQTSGLTSGSTFPIGTSTVEYTATDIGGNTAVCTFTVTVTDTELPTITCATPAASYDADGGVCTYTHSGTSLDPTAFGDNCSGSTIQNDFNNTATLDGATFPLGSTTVVWTVTDGSGNVSTCSNSVVVVDNEAPTAICQNITVPLGAGGSVSIVPSQVDNGSFDNCSIGGLGVLPNNFTCGNLGANTVTLTVLDNAGNTATCASTVTVIDNIAPTAVCQDITIQLDATGNATVTGAAINNGSTDNCSIATLTANPNTFTCADAGTTVPVTLTVTDQSGNASACIANVTVQDNVVPTVTCNNFTVALDATGNATITTDDIGGLTAADACGPVVVTASTLAFDCSMTGDNTVTLTATDNNGNTATCNATVTVEDNIDPVITCPGDVTVSNDPGVCGATVTYAAPTATDNCGGVTTETYYIPLAQVTPFESTSGPNCNVIGTDIWGCNVDLGITWNSIGSGIVSNVDVELFQSWNGNAGFTSVFNAIPDNPLTFAGPFGVCNNFVNSISLNPGSYNVGGLNQLTFNVASEASCLVFDRNPDISWIPNSYARVIVTYGGGGSLSVSQTDATGLTSGDVFPVGTTTLEYTATDDSGNTDVCTFNVTVTDNEAPVANCQNITVQLDASGNATIVAADVDNASTDNCAVTATSIDVSAFTCPNVGPNNVTLTVEDAAGNSSSCVAVVTIEDNVAPTVTCNDFTVALDAAGNATITTNDIGGATAADACGIASVTASQTAFTCANVGSNTVTLTVTDNNGNASTCNATVTVEDNVAPTAVCIAPATVFALDASGNLTITGADIDGGSTDACGIASLTASPNTFTCANIGINNVTLTVTDNNGNVSVCNTTIDVQDQTAPVITCPADITVNAIINNCGRTVTYNFNVVDACATISQTDGTGLTSGSLFPVGTTVQTYEVTDQTGTYTCTFNVTVNDIQNPIITNCPSNITVSNDAGRCDARVLWTEPIASDNCPAVSFTSTHSPGDVFLLGTTTVTYTATDASGNTAVCSFNVTVNDNESPVITACTPDVLVSNDPTVCGAIVTFTPPTLSLIHI